MAYIDVTIHYNWAYQDSLKFRADDIEQAKETAKKECEKRWRDEKECRSETEEKLD